MNDNGFGLSLPISILISIAILVGGFLINILISRQTYKINAKFMQLISMLYKNI